MSLSLERFDEDESTPDLADHQIEDRNYRKKHLRSADEGLMCISVEPGEESLGELYFNTQFEAQVGEHALCQRGQNRILIRGSDWLKDLLDRIGDGEWRFALVSQPCPHVPAEGVQDAVERAAQVMAGDLSMTQALKAENQAQPSVASAVQIVQQTKHDLTGDVES